MIKLKKKLWSLTITDEVVSNQFVFAKLAVKKIHQKIMMQFLLNSMLKLALVQTDFHQEKHSSAEMGLLTVGRCWL